jgi:anti-sigma regulatory factor (Ser/Thr protein kinase)
MLLDRLTPTGGSFAGEPGVLELALPAEPSSAAAARHSLAAYCRDHGVPTQLTDDALLVISELVTNAVLHAGTDLEVSISRYGDRLRVAVRDHSSRSPASRPFEPEAPDGRGMLLITATCQSWGVLLTGGGKVVWAVLAA